MNRPAHNTCLAKKAGSVINLMFVFSLLVAVLNRSFRLVYPLLRQALKRYAQCYKTDPCLTTKYNLPSTAPQSGVPVPISIPLCSIFKIRSVSVDFG